MKDYQTVEISSDFRVRIVDVPSQLLLSDAVQRRIELLWETELARRPGQLFNGKVLRVLSHSSSEIVASFVEYKQFLAQHRDPSLDRFLKIRSLGSAGLTIVQDPKGPRVLIGKRSAAVTEYVHYYEFAPAGSLDPDCRNGDYADFCKQLILELEEEVGIASSAISRITPLVLVYDRLHQAWDICCELQVAPFPLEQALSSTPEYDELLWIPVDQLKQFFETNLDRIIPTSKALAAWRYGIKEKNS